VIYVAAWASIGSLFSVMIAAVMRVADQDRWPYSVIWYRTRLRHSLVVAAILWPYAALILFFMAMSQFSTVAIDYFDRKTAKLDAKYHQQVRRG